MQTAILDDDGRIIATEPGNLQVVVINGNPTITSIQTTNIAENETTVVSGTFSDPTWHSYGNLRRHRNLERWSQHAAYRSYRWQL